MVSRQLPAPVQIYLDRTKQTSARVVPLTGEPVAQDNLGESGAVDDRHCDLVARLAAVLQCAPGGGKRRA